MISYAPPAWSPEWFNYGMFATGISLVCTAVAVWLILELHQRAVINQESIILRFDVGSWIPIITKYYYAMFIVVGILAFPLGVWFSPSQSQDHTNPMSLSIDSHRKTAIAQRDDLIPLLSDQSDVVIPLTPERLIDIARTQTTRDAMSYKGALIHFQGTVLNIREVQERWSEVDASRKPVIGIRVAIGPQPHDRSSDQAHMFVDANQWKSQVDKVKRGDWIVAKGIVDHVSANLVGLIGGEITSVSRGAGNR